jgi:hypothetical protein
MTAEDSGITSGLRAMILLKVLSHPMEAAATFRFRLLYPLDRISWFLPPFASLAYSTCNLHTPHDMINSPTKFFLATARRMAISTCHASRCHSKLGTGPLRPAGVKLAPGGTLACNAAAGAINRHGCLFIAPAPTMQRVASRRLQVLRRYQPDGAQRASADVQTVSSRKAPPADQLMLELPSLSKVRLHNMQAIPLSHLASAYAWANTPSSVVWLRSQKPCGHGLDVLSPGHRWSSVSLIY